jgi:hypothetical protein
MTQSHEFKFDLAQSYLGPLLDDAKHFGALAGSRGDFC